MSSRLAFIVSLVVAIGVASGVVLARDRVSGDQSPPASASSTNAAAVSTSPPTATNVQIAEVVHRNPPVTLVPTPRATERVTVANRSDDDGEAHDDDHESHDHEGDDHEEDDD
jgi:hypothetical protein